VAVERVDAVRRAVEAKARDGHQPGDPRAPDEQRGDRERARRAPPSGARGIIEIAPEEPRAEHLRSPVERIVEALRARVEQLSIKRDELKRVEPIGIQEER